MKKPVWSGDWPIPARVALPGCRVRVKLVPRGSSGLGQSDAVFVYQFSEDSAYAYAKILIDEALPLPVQRYCLVHELQHAMTELLDVMVEQFLTEVHPKVISEALCTSPLPASSS